MDFISELRRKNVVRRYLQKAREKGLLETDKIEMRFAKQMISAEFTSAFKIHIKMKGPWNKNNNIWKVFKDRNKLLTREIKH